MVRRIFLITTYECNLRCKYCYESNKHEGSFNVSKTIEILTTEFEQQQFDEFRISFYGGEPFLEFPKIKEIDTGLISFTEDCYNAREILGFIAKENIPFIKIEQRERSLEDLFLGGAVQ